MGGWLRTAAVAIPARRGRRGIGPVFPVQVPHIFVPYPAGGGVDVLTRTLGDVVSKQWGQSVVVETVRAPAASLPRRRRSRPHRRMATP
jgi:tripartite-type tricarboxylate transporter receptor subunit TctC